MPVQLLRSLLLFLFVCFLFACLLAPCALFAQVGIGTTTPDANAILELHNDATPRGLLLPRMNTDARNTLGGSLTIAHVGMMVADTSDTEGGVYVWDGNSWASLTSSGGITGGGTANYLPRWTAGDELGNSILRDNGTSLGIGVNPNANSLLRINSARQTTIDIIHAGGNPANFGVRAVIANDFGEKIAIYGESSGATGDKIGLRGIAGGGSGETNLYGVYGSATNNNGSKHGVRAEASGAGTVNRGILTSATGAATQNYGIHSSASGGTTNWAGYFESGNVNIDNALRLAGLPTGGGSHLLVRDAANWVNALAFSGNATDVLRGDGSFGAVPGAIATGSSLGQSLRWNGTTWEANDMLRVGISDRVGVGTGTNVPQRLFTVSNQASALSAVARVVNFDAGGVGTGGELELARVNSTTPTAATAVAGTNMLGTLRFAGADGVSVQGSSSIFSQATQTWSTTARGSSLMFATVANDNVTGSVRLAIQQNGNVGIGTSNPARRLHVVGDVRITDLVSGTNGALVRSNTLGDLLTTDFTGNANHVLRGDGSFGAVPGALPTGATAGQTLRWTGSSWLNNSVLFVSASNRVGIGAPAPTSSLSVVESVGLAVDNGVFIDVTNTSLQSEGSMSGIRFKTAHANTSNERFDAGIAYARPGSNGRLFFMVKPHSATNVSRTADAGMVLSEEKEVAIGTAIPRSTLHVEAEWPELFIRNQQQQNNLGTLIGSIGFGSERSGIDFVRSAQIRAVRDASTSTNTSLPTRLEFLTTPTGTSDPVLQMVIRNNGHVGIGSNNPQALLHVGGTFAASGKAVVGSTSTANESYLTALAPSTTGEEVAFKAARNSFTNGNIVRLRIAAVGGANPATNFWDLTAERAGFGSGPFAIRNANDNIQFAINASGGITMPNIIAAAGDAAMRYNTTSGVVSYQASSIRYKENVTPLAETYPIRKVLELEPAHFLYKEDKKPDVGLIAEEVVKVFPDMVFYKPDSTGNLIIEGVKYEQLSIRLLALAQAQDSTIHAQQERIQKLEQELLQSKSGQEDIERSQKAMRMDIQELQAKLETLLPKEQATD